MKRAITEFIGCDLGDKNSHICVLNADGQVVGREKIATTQEAFRKRFGAKGKQRCQLVIEAGVHSPWVSRLLKTMGLQVVVANPRRVKLISASHDKGDSVDAERLARLGRADPQLLSPIEHRSEAAQDNLVAIKMRKHLVQTRTDLINFVRGICKSAGIKLPKCETECFSTRALKQLPEDLAQSLRPVFELLDSLCDQIAQTDTLIEARAEQSAEIQALRQVTGVGALTAQTFIYTIDNPKRFKRSRDVGAYLGLTPKRSQSGERDPQLRITKCGDVYLRSLLVNCSHYIMGRFGPDCDLRRHGLRIAKDGGKNAKKRAIIAVARKLAVLLHRLWLTGEEYQPLGYGKSLKAA